MKTSKELLGQANITPFLKLAIQKEGGGVEGTGPHKVKLIEDKAVMINEYPSQKEVSGIRYVVEENGEKKKYEVPIKDKGGELHYLIQRLAEFNEGDEIILEYQRRGIKGFISVKKAGEEIKSGENPDGEIPIVEEGDGTPPTGEEDISIEDIPF